MDYTIGKVKRTNFLDNRGASVDGYRVWYELENGTPDYIEIEKSRYNAANVRTAIEEEIAVHEELVGMA